MSARLKLAIAASASWGCRWCAGCAARATTSPPTTSARSGWLWRAKPALSPPISRPAWWRGRISSCSTCRRPKRSRRPSSARTGSPPPCIRGRQSSISRPSPSSAAGDSRRGCWRSAAAAGSMRRFPAGPPAAGSGTLTIMAGGRPEDIEAVRPLMADVAARFTPMGPSGAGLAAKMINQMIVARSTPCWPKRLSRPRPPASTPRASPSASPAAMPTGRCCSATIPAWRRANFAPQATSASC